MTDALDQDRGSMARLAVGEDLALNEIMERWKTRLVAFLYRLTGNEASSLELAEETFVRVYQNRTKFRPDANFSSWLFGIAANLGRNHLRWQRRHPTLPLDAAEATAMEGNPGDSAESREREDAVRSAIAALPPDLREALVLAEYENLSYSEIAEIAECSVKAVERRLSRAREILRKGLSRYLQG
ncbi:MAG: sigma-70 family RNA polymerase sigma factor [Verrucomicrobia bacterium]|nr:sigma-70 family RNA polymerase sigma factor [Verrucomicrobiota bacterium]